MITKQNTAIALFLLIFFTACKNQLPNVKTADFEIYIPEDFQKTTEILDSAEIQFMNPEKNIYLAVEKTQTNENIDTFINENIYSLFDEITDKTADTITINQENAVLINFTEDNITEEYKWEILVSPHQNNIFILWIWTKSDNFTKNKNIIRQISSSFAFLH